MPAPKLKTTAYYRYADDVISGKIVAGKYIQMVCEKFIADVGRSGDDKFKWWFYPNEVEIVLSFFAMMRLVKGSNTGKPFIPPAWFQLLLAAIYGFRNKDNTAERRYKDVLAQVGRKNSKTTCMAGLFLYELFIGPENSEFYTISGDREQATIIWKIAVLLYQTLPANYAVLFDSKNKQITCSRTNSYFKAMSSETKSYNGPQPYMFIIDEASVIMDPDAHYEMESGQLGMVSPLKICISTASPRGRESEWYSLLEAAKLDIVAGRESVTFAMPYELDEKEEMHDPTKWIKANPSIDLPDVRDKISKQYDKALKSPAAYSSFLTKHCNLYEDFEENWLSVQMYWDRNEISADDMAEFKTVANAVYMGVDFARVDDLASIVLIFYDAVHDIYAIEPYCYLPETTYNNLTTEYRSIYERAVADGNLELQKGRDTITDEVMYAEIMSKFAKYNVVEIGYDKYKNTNLVERFIDEQVPIIAVKQTYQAENKTLIDVEKLIYEGKLKCVKNRFYDWQMTNCVDKANPSDERKLIKKTAKCKIDAVKAMLVGMDRAYAPMEPVEPPKHYGFSMVQLD